MYKVLIAFLLLVGCSNSQEKEKNEKYLVYVGPTAMLCGHMNGMTHYMYLSKCVIAGSKSSEEFEVINATNIIKLDSEE